MNSESLYTYSKGMTPLESSRLILTARRPLAARFSKLAPLGVVLKPILPITLHLYRLEGHSTVKGKWRPLHVILIVRTVKY